MRAVYLYLVFLTSAVISVIVGSSGCSSNTPAFDGIANRGVTPVSPHNPFMGANVFLAQEMEKSGYLYNFMKGRGAPQAIQVRGDSERSSELLMFYSRTLEYYSAVPQRDNQTKITEWIIRGPFPITREHYPYIAPLNSAQGGAFEVFGKRENFGGAAVATESRVIEPAFVPTPTPTPTPMPRKPRIKKTPPSGGVPPVIPGSSADRTPGNLDQAAILEARRTPSATPTGTTPPSASSTTPQKSHQTLDDALKSSIGTTAAPPSASNGE